MYVTCIYFIVATVSTTGYGDVVAKSSVERGNIDTVMAILHISHTTFCLIYLDSLVCIREIHYITRMPPKLLRYVEDIGAIKGIYLFITFTFIYQLYAIISDFHSHTVLCK